MKLRNKAMKKNKKNVSEIENINNYENGEFCLIDFIEKRIPENERSVNNILNLIFNENKTNKYSKRRP